MAGFSAEELQSIRGLFAQLDVENVGYLSLETLQGFLDSQGSIVSKEALQVQFQSIVGTEVIRIQEQDFIVWMAQLQGRSHSSLETVPAEETMRPHHTEPSPSSASHSKEVRVAESPPHVPEPPSHLPGEGPVAEKVGTPRTSGQLSDVAVTSVKLPSAGSARKSRSSKQGDICRQSLLAPPSNRLSMKKMSMKSSHSLSSSRSLSVDGAQSARQRQSRTGKLMIPKVGDGRCLERRESAPLPASSSPHRPPVRRRMTTIGLPSGAERKIQVEKNRETIRRVSSLVRASIASLFDSRRQSAHSVRSNADSSPGSRKSAQSNASTTSKRGDDDAELAMLLEVKQLVMEVQRLSLPSYIAEVVAECMRQQEPDPTQIQQTGDLVARLLQDRPEFEPPEPLEFSVELQQIRQEVCGRLEHEVTAVQKEVRNLNQVVGMSWSTITIQKDLIQSLSGEAQALTDTTARLEAQSDGSLDPAAMQLASQRITEQLDLVREATTSIVKELSEYAEGLSVHNSTTPRLQHQRDSASLDSDSVFGGTLSYTDDSCFTKGLSTGQENTQPFGASLKSHLQHLRQRMNDLSASAHHRSQMLASSSTSPKRAKRPKPIQVEDFLTQVEVHQAAQGRPVPDERDESHSRRGSSAPHERDEMRSVLQAALDTKDIPRLNHFVTDSSPKSVSSDTTLRKPMNSSSTSLSPELTQRMPRTSKEREEIPSLGGDDAAVSTLASKRHDVTFVAHRKPAVPVERHTEQLPKYAQLKYDHSQTLQKPKDLLFQLKLRTDELREHAEKTEFLRDAASFALESGMSLRDASCHLQGLRAVPRWQQRHHQRTFQFEAPTPPEAPPEHHCPSEACAHEDALARREHYIDSWLMS